MASQGTPVATRDSARDRIRVGDISLAFRDPWDILSIVEIYALDVYPAALIPRGGVVLDAGAGIGDFSILASKRVGEAGTVVAVEPSPFDFLILEENIRRNECRNVVAIRGGLGARSGLGSTSFKGKSFEFPTRTIHQLLVEVGAPRFNYVKMDVEGAENEIVHSSIDELAQARVIALELHGDQTALVRLLGERGFEMSRLTQLDVVGRAMAYSFRHPLLAARMYHGVRRATRRSPVRRLIQGVEIAEGGALTAAVFSMAQV